MSPDSAQLEHLPLKPVTFSVLLALREREDYGYGIAKRISEPAGGGIQLAPSNMYNVLDRLVARGLIESAEGDGDEDVRRGYYRLTSLGEAVLRAETHRLRTLLDTVSAPAGATGSGL
jgi:DNA-binding PadR family transcriptional regulator